MKNQDENKWISQGLKVSCKILWCFIESTKKTHSNNYSCK